MNKLEVCEIFKSIQGESTFTGLVCSFVRLSGCNLRCDYCDTSYAFTEKTLMTIDAIVSIVESHDTKLVEITGGEPLIQKFTPELCNKFLEKGFEVLVETNGSCDISVISSECHRILDIKCPGSGMTDSFLESNITVLSRKDELKYVISDESDFYWALNHVQMHKLQCYTPIFSPNLNRISANELASLIIKSNAPVRLGLQLHKFIWGDIRGV